MLVVNENVIKPKDVEKVKREDWLRICEDRKEEIEEIVESQ
jgi:hypothetical protein